MTIGGSNTNAVNNATGKTFFKECFLNPTIARSSVRISQSE
jgi:hypothetical protein